MDGPGRTIKLFVRLVNSIDTTVKFNPDEPVYFKNFVRFS